MSENFAVSIYNDAFEVVSPGNFSYAHPQVSTEASMYQPSEIPDPERSEVEIAVTAIMVIAGVIAVAGSIYLNHRHNQKTTKRMVSNDRCGLDRDHSLQ